MLCPDERFQEIDLHQNPLKLGDRSSYGKLAPVFSYLSTTPWRRMKVDVKIRIFLTSALVGGERSASRPGRFTPGERVPATQWIGGWVDPIAGLDDVENRKFLTLPGLELRPLGFPARS
jgi:hypothetical protein